MRQFKFQSPAPAGSRARVGVRALLPLLLIAPLAAPSWRAAAADAVPVSATTNAGAAPDAASEAVPDAARDAALALRRFQQERAARFIDWLADGSLLIATRFGDTQQIHRLRAPLGMREQLSFGDGDVLNAAARPFASDAFVYQSSADGGRTSSLYLVRLADHASVRLTGEGYRDESPLFAHDGQRIAFSSNRAAAADRAIYVLDTTHPGAAPRLAAGSSGERWRVFAWSADDRRLLLGRESPGVDGYELGFVDLATGTLTPIQLAPAARARGGRAEPARALRARAARFAPDGHGLIVLGLPDTGPVASEFATLRYVDPGTGETRDLLPAMTHDVELFDESPDGRYLAYAINDDGVSRLLLVDQKDRLESAVGELPVGIIHSLRFDATGTHLAVGVESAQAPEDVYVYEPGTQDLRRWTAGELGPVDPAELVGPQLRHFPTWDRIEGQQRVLGAFVYGAGAPLPAGAAPRPVLILLRGAPGAQFRPGYDPFLQYLVSVLRFVVVAPNVRGASGYGRSFRALADGALRDDASRDVGSLLAWVGLQDGLDRERVFVMGEGASDSLALAVLAQYGDRLQGGIAVGPPIVPPLPAPVTIRRPVLLAAMIAPPDLPADSAIAVPNDPFGIFAFRLRSAGTNARYVAFSGNYPGAMRRADRVDCEREIARFLVQLLR
jgi:dipeptidyl aminopeptidase/acylaminoacyl peptidase